MGGLTEFSGFNYVYCKNNADLENITSELISKHDNKQIISYDVNTSNNDIINITNSKQLKYKNSVIFISMNKFNKNKNGLSEKSSVRFGTPVFIFGFYDNISKNDLTRGPSILSPNINLVNCDDIINSLQIKQIYRNEWISIKMRSNMNQEIEFYKTNITTSNYKNVFIKQTDFDKSYITKEDYIEYSIDNPIEYKNQYEVLDFF